MKKRMKKPQKPAEAPQETGFTMDDLARRFLSLPPAPDRPAPKKKATAKKAAQKTPPSTPRKRPRRS